MKISFHEISIITLVACICLTVTDAWTTQELVPSDYEQQPFITPKNLEEICRDGAESLEVCADSLIQSAPTSRKKRSIQNSEPKNDISALDSIILSKPYSPESQTEQLYFDGETKFHDPSDKRAKFSAWGGKRDKFSSWGGKRAKFNSWGGKRSIENHLSEEDDEDLEKRAKFNSWGGKRAGDSEEKRAKFNSWGGKRAEDSEEKRAKFNSWGGKRFDTAEMSLEPEKRAKFNSWGGKRSGETEDLFESDKRAKFNSWGGKRSNELEDYTDEDKRAKFNSWGGKRSNGIQESDVEKRAKFNSWGGKRSEEEYDDLDNSLYESDKRAKFNSWGGKRSAKLGDIDSLFPLYQYSSKRKFNSWGGKRGVDNNESDDDAEDEGFQDWGGKREYYWNTQPWKLSYPNKGLRLRNFLNWGTKRKFSSWAGKRSDPSFQVLPQKRFFYQVYKKLFEKNLKSPETSWGGKRGTNTRAFQSWGGKRSVFDTLKDLNDEYSQTNGNLDETLTQLSSNSDVEKRSVSVSSNSVDQNNNNKTFV